MDVLINTSKWSNAMKINTYVELQWNKDTKTYDEVYCEYFKATNVALCKGGGSSGEVAHPSYIEQTYNIFMSGTLEDPVATDYTGTTLMAAISTATLLDPNPYTDATSFAPDSMMAVSQDALDNYYDECISSDVSIATSRFTDINASSIAKADAIYTGDAIDDLVQQFAIKSEYDYNKDVNTFTGGMSEMNAINSSAFILGFAQLKSKRLQDIDEFRAKLVTDNEAKRAGYIAKANSDMIGILTSYMGQRIEAIKWQVEINRLGTIAKKEQYSADLEIDRADALWDIQTIKEGFAALSTPGGGQILSDKPTGGQSAMSGALAGAAIGGMVGGVPGAIAGGLIGGIGGYLSA